MEYILIKLKKSFHHKVYKKGLKRVTKLHHKEWEDYKERKGEIKKL